MSAKHKRLSYSAAFKLNVIKFVKQHGNSAAKRHFGPPPNEKMIAFRKNKGRIIEARK
jgi:transposase-like protein